MIDSVRFLLKRNFAIRVFKSRGYEQSLEKGWKLVQTQILIFSPKNNIWKHIFPIFPNFHMFGEFLMVVSKLGIVSFGTLCSKFNSFAFVMRDFFLLAGNKVWDFREFHATLFPSYKKRLSVSNVWFSVLSRIQKILYLMVKNNFFLSVKPSLHLPQICVLYFH